jgi:hypothetical protein
LEVGGLLVRSARSLSCRAICDRIAAQHQLRGLEQRLVHTEAEIPSGRG